ncbi:MAG: HIT family protein [Anaeroplasmataceae bacterium]
MCIFCKIVNNEIPSYKVFENDTVLAILDISQASYAHTLVIPKKHYYNLLDVNDTDYIEVMKVVKKITKLYDNKMDVAGFNILNNCKEFAGQTVNHFHVHILPRFKNKINSVKIELGSNDYNLEDIIDILK